MDKALPLPRDEGANMAISTTKNTSGESLYNPGASATSSFEIDSVGVGRSDRTYVIAEVAQAHDGSLGHAISFVDAAKKAGADAVKFQTHIAAEESTVEEPWRIRFSPEDERRYDYWKRMEFSPQAWGKIAERCNEVGITFLSSAFSLEAIRLLEKLDMSAWKVGSGEVSTFPLIEAMAKTGMPVLISSGMSTWKEVEDAVALVQGKGAPCGVFQCTSAYPTPVQNVGLNVLREMMERFEVPVGLSDHSASATPSVAAAALGASMVEVHIAMSKHAFGPDTSSSLTVEEFGAMVSQIREIDLMRSFNVDKDQRANQLQAMRDTFQKYIVASRPLVAGAILSESDFRYKKTGRGVLARDVNTLLGAQLNRDIDPDEVIKIEDVGR